MSQRRYNLRSRSRQDVTKSSMAERDLPNDEPMINKRGNGTKRGEKALAPVSSMEDEEYTPEVPAQKRLKLALPPLEEDLGSDDVYDPTVQTTKKSQNKSKTSRKTSRKTTRKTTRKTSGKSRGRKTKEEKKAAKIQRKRVANIGNADISQLSMSLRRDANGLSLSEAVRKNFTNDDSTRRNGDSVSTNANLRSGAAIRCVIEELEENINDEIDDELESELDGAYANVNGNVHRNRNRNININTNINTNINANTNSNSNAIPPPVIPRERQEKKAKRQWDDKNCVELQKIMKRIATEGHVHEIPLRGGGLTHYQWVLVCKELKEKTKWDEIDSFAVSQKFRSQANCKTGSWFKAWSPIWEDIINRSADATTATNGGCLQSLEKQVQDEKTAQKKGGSLQELQKEELKARIECSKKVSDGVTLLTNNLQMNQMGLHLWNMINSNNNVNNNGNNGTNVVSMGGVGSNDVGGNGVGGSGAPGMFGMSPCPAFYGFGNSMGFNNGIGLNAFQLSNLNNLIGAQNMNGVSGINGFNLNLNALNNMSSGAIDKNQDKDKKIESLRQQEKDKETQNDKQ